MGNTQNKAVALLQQSQPQNSNVELGVVAVNVLHFLQIQLSSAHIRIAVFTADLVNKGKI